MAVVKTRTVNHWTELVWQSSQRHRTLVPSTGARKVIEYDCELSTRTPDIVDFEAVRMVLRGVSEDSLRDTGVRLVFMSFGFPRGSRRSRSKTTSVQLLSTRPVLSTLSCSVRRGPAKLSLPGPSASARWMLRLRPSSSFAPPLRG